MVRNAVHYALLNTLTVGTRRSHAFWQLFNNGNDVPTRFPSKRPPLLLTRRANTSLRRGIFREWSTTCWKRTRWQRTRSDSVMRWCWAHISTLRRVTSNWTTTWTPCTTAITHWKCNRATRRRCTGEPRFVCYITTLTTFSLRRNLINIRWE